MSQAFKLITILVLSSLIASASARRSLFKYCRDLGESMASNLAVYSNAQEAFKAAKNHLKSIKNFGMDSRNRLASAWEAVIKEEAECGPHSGDHVWTIMDCHPEKSDALVTLDIAVRRYAVKCLGATFWDGQLRKALGSKDKSGLLGFMNSRFIDDYYEENPDEPKIHFGTKEGTNCCRPENSLNSLWAAADSSVGPEKTGRLIESDSEGLDKFIEKHLLKPCAKFVELTADLMKKAERTSKYHAQEERDFISGLSHDFQYAIFRYKYCTNLKMLAEKQCSTNRRHLMASRTPLET